MNKVISIVIGCVLVVALVVTGVLYSQASGDLKAAESEVATQKTTISGLQTDLASSRAEAASLRTQLTTSEALVVTLNGNITTLTSNLAASNSQLSAAQTANTALTAELKLVKDPRHFNSLTELTDWLQQDDTNIEYASSNAARRSFILQIRALRDGFLLPAGYWADSTTTYWYNTAIIGGIIYNVSSYSDDCWIDDYITPQSSHPEPLP